jgi:ribosomal protein S18 acetylase RimI-like enzyme
MDIVEADVSDAEDLVDNLWFPLAREMEEVSEFNRLSDSGVRSDAVKYFTDRLRKDKHRFFIVRVDGEDAGFISVEDRTARPVFERDKYGHVHELFVKKDFRRQGIASKLLERVEDYCQEKDFDMIRLSVNVRNDSAKQLYQSHDFYAERTMMIKDLE